MTDARLLAMHRPVLNPRWGADNGDAWSTVTHAVPRFPGHDQPRRPAAPGPYARTTPAVLAAQAALARANGIEGFCFQIEASDTGGEAIALVAEWLGAAGSSALPFCLMWRNVPTQVPSAIGDDTPVAADPNGDAFMTRLLSLAAHPAYVRIDGAPLVLVERLDCLSSPAAVTASWRTRLRATLGVEPFLIAAHARWHGNPTLHGFDAGFSWPPAGAILEPLNKVHGATAGAVAVINDYRRLVVETVLRPCPPYPLLQTVLSGWDDTPLREGAGQVLLHATPDAFEFWLREAIERTQLRFPPAQRVVFLRAWNDWLSGCFLEPDERYGMQFLAAIPRAKAAAREAPPTVSIPRGSGVHDSGNASAASRSPRVSVVVPAYNHERYIESALRSVHAQTFADLELVIVDDGSTDNTLSLARKLADSAPRPTTVIAQANAGAHAAINCGIAAARGEYIAILNSDDLYEPSRIQQLVRRLDDTGAMLGFSDVLFIDQAGQAVDEQLPYVRGLRTLLAQLAEQPYPELALIAVNGAISTGNFFFRRSLVDRIGGFRALVAVHDWDFLLAASNVGRIAFVPERLYRYRLHDANTFSRNTLKSLFEIEATFRRFFENLETHPLRGHPDAGPRLLTAVRQSAHAGALSPALRGPRALSYSDWVLGMRPTTAQLAALAAQSREWPRRPLLSVLVTTYNSPERWLQRALDSVLEQTYDHWECCIADDASPRSEVRAILAEYARRDPRIRIEFRDRNGHISAATNTALALARGEFIVLLDHDDELAPDALHWVAREVIEHPDAEMIYSDEDKIDEHGMRTEPHFKTAWNPELLGGQNCISHLGVYRTERVRALGGFREGTEGAQDWDLALRVGGASGNGRVRHIPRVLYHWRTIAGSAAIGSDQKEYVLHAQRQVLEDHVARQGIAARVVPAGNGGFWRLQIQLPAKRPKVSIVLRGHPHGVEPGAAIAQWMRSQTYGPVEVIVATDHAAAHSAGPMSSSPPASAQGEVRDLATALAQARGDVLCFATPELAGASRGWLEELVAQALRPGVGAAGPIVVDTGGTIVEGGWIGAGRRGFAPLYAGCPRGHLGPFAHARLVQNLSVVGARCVAITRETFEASGGMSAGAPPGWELVDLCLRLTERGLRNVWTPFSELLLRTPDAWVPLLQAALDDDRGAAWRQRWICYTDDDPAYNANYARDGPQFSLALPPRGQATPAGPTLSAAHP